MWTFFVQTIRAPAQLNRNYQSIAQVLESFKQQVGHVVTAFLKGWILIVASLQMLTQNIVLLTVLGLWVWKIPLYFKTKLSGKSMCSIFSSWRLKMVPVDVFIIVSFVCTSAEIFVDLSWCFCNRLPRVYVSSLKQLASYGNNSRPFACTQHWARGCELVVVLVLCLSWASWLKKATFIE